MNEHLSNTHQAACDKIHIVLNTLLELTNHIIICYMLQTTLTQVLTLQISWTMLDQFPSQEIIILYVLLISCKLGMGIFGQNTTNIRLPLKLVH